MNKIVISILSVIAVLLCSCESSDEKVYKSVISKYDILMSEFNAAQTEEVLTATTEKLSSFENSTLKQDYDSLCAIDKVPKDIQQLVNSKVTEVANAQSEARSRVK